MEDVTKLRIGYGMLWILTVIAFSVPWYSAGLETYSGWNFVVPFSVTYLIGIILGLVVLLTKKKPLVFTVLAGILMLLGVIISWVFGELLVGLSELTGEEASGEPGIGFAFLMSIIYAAVGGWLGSTWEAKLEEEKLQEKPETTKKTGGGKQ